MRTTIISAVCAGLGLTVAFTYTHAQQLPAQQPPAQQPAQRVAPALGSLLGGPLRKYRPVPARVVGVAMVGTALAEHAGVRVLHYDELVRAASGLQARVEDA